MRLKGSHPTWPCPSSGEWNPGCLLSCDVGDCASIGTDVGDGERISVGQPNLSGERRRFRSVLTEDTGDCRALNVGESRSSPGSLILSKPALLPGSQSVDCFAPTIHSFVFCDGAIVKAKAIREPGVVLSFKVIIGENFTVSACTPKLLLFIKGPRNTEMIRNWSPKEVRVMMLPKALPLRFLVEVGGFGWKSSSGQEEEWRHSVASIPNEKKQDIAACEEEGKLDDAAQDPIVVPSNDYAPGVDTDEETHEDDKAYFQQEAIVQLLRLDLFFN